MCPVVDERHNRSRRRERRPIGAGALSHKIVETLSGRLTPDQMHVWVSHPEKCHPVPDADSAKVLEQAGLVPVVIHWTPVNAVSAGTAGLVVAEAKRFAARN